MPATYEEVDLPRQPCLLSSIGCSKGFVWQMIDPMRVIRRSYIR